MKSSRRIAGVLAGAAALALAGAQAAPQAEYDRLFDETMAHYALPGMALGIVEDGQVVYRRSAGTRLAGSGEDIDSQTIFKIASNSKAMTAALLARLVDAGRLRWDDPVTRHLPRFRMNDPWVTRNIQVRDLLIHNSGLGLGAGDLMLWPEPNEFSRADVIAGVAYLKPATSFRSTYAYDNLLYIVAGEVAAAAGEADYETLLRREVFEPLALARCQVGAFARDTVGNIAQPHRRQGGANVPGGVDEAVIPAISSAAAGGVRCSLDDMLAWMRNWIDPALTPDWLSPEQRRAMWTAHMPMPIGALQRQWENTHFSAYGYAFRLSDVNGRFRVGHTGTLDGMYSAMAMFPDSRRGYVFLINGEAGQARQALEAALSRLMTQPDSAPRIADFAQDLDARRAASGAAQARAQAAARAPVAPADLGETLGVYADAWLGDIRLCPEEGVVRWRSRKSPRLFGTVQRAGSRLLVAWEDAGAEGADAWLDISPGVGGSTTMRMAAIDPETDFSFDFHDLSPQRIRSCD